MAARASPLDDISIAKPCPSSWNDMAGDERVRFCTHCSLHVYNLSGMSRGQAEDFLAEREGRTCIRMHRRADGTVLTQDCPVGLRAWRRRLACVGALAAGLLIAVIGFTAVLLGASRNEPGNNPNLGFVQRIKEWLFPSPPPPPIMGMMVPVGPRPIAPPPIAPPPPPELPK